MPFFQSQGWHEGEHKIHELTSVPENENPQVPSLPPRYALTIPYYSLLALGTLDAEDWPWTTVWGGDPPLAQQVAKNTLGIRADVDASFDPFVQAVWQGKDNGEVVGAEGEQGGRMISGLSIQLEQRSRLKLYGRMLASALNTDEEAQAPTGNMDKIPANGRAGHAQLIIHIEQSLGNCPKYLNKKRITSHKPSPRLLSTASHLSQEAMNLVSKADVFFVSSAHAHEDMDTNHRGGPPGFIRVQQPADENEPSTIVWPEYSGNNLYQTLGNLMATPRAGIAIPDFETGDVLYLTGDTEVLVGPAASKVIAKSKLAVQLRVKAARLVHDGLPFRGTPIDDGLQGLSPYNPRVRYLTSEKSEEFGNGSGSTAPVTAKLVKKTVLTPSINRYRFAMADPMVLGPWKPGQHVALDFSADLDHGYSHMREDDPTSLNDDFLRTFTVSSAPRTLGEHEEEFEVTVRNVGSATAWLARQREGVAEVGVRGFGGDFKFAQDNGTSIGFVAAGIGITPLLGQMQDIDAKRLRLLWSLSVRDVALALDVFDQFPKLKGSTTLYLTGIESDLDSTKSGTLRLMDELGIVVRGRRMNQEDLNGVDAGLGDWYLCTAPAMRKQVQAWLPSRVIVFENFDY